jgi:hypothetical protein
MTKEKQIKLRSKMKYLYNPMENAADLAVKERCMGRKLGNVGEVSESQGEMYGIACSKPRH